VNRTNILVLHFHSTINDFWLKSHLHYVVKLEI